MTYRSTCMQTVHTCTCLDSVAAFTCKRLGHMNLQCTAREQSMNTKQGHIQKSLQTCLCLDRPKCKFLSFVTVLHSAACTKCSIVHLVSCLHKFWVHQNGCITVHCTGMQCSVLHTRWPTVYQVLHACMHAIVPYILVHCVFSSWYSSVHYVHVMPCVLRALCMFRPIHQTSVHFF